MDQQPRLDSGHRTTAAKDSNFSELESEETLSKKRKHTLDSDEEDDEKVRQKYDVLNADDIEGEEDGDVRHEDEIRITPFNMKEELEEGHFDREGMYIFAKESKEASDHWLENIDWVKVQERPAISESVTDQAPDSQVNTLECYRSILTFLMPGESVHKAICRLGQKTSAGHRGRKEEKATGRRDSVPKQLPKNEESGHHLKQQMISLIALADQLISSGDMDAYERTYEQLTFRLNKDKEKKETVEVDIFSDPNSESQTQEATDKTAVKWELRWSESEEAEVHGPFSNEQMIQWRDAGYFSSHAFVRQTGRANASFNSAKRIDFDLYS